MKTTFLSHFTPSLMTPEALEAIFVQREELAKRLVELIRESAFTASRHHALLIGPRGIGKTHLIALIYHRVLAMEDLRDRLIVAWLREEEWGVTSFLDLLLRIFRVLPEKSDDIEKRIESLYDLPPDAAERAGARLLKEVSGDRTLLLLVENMDDLFNGLGDEGQKRLRAYLQENPFCSILATAQSLFGGVSLQTSPFYGFFRIHHLDGLEIEEATRLLTNIASFAGDRDLASFIQTPTGRARIRAIHHLAGGNHRVYVIFSHFLTRESLDELVEPFLHTLDELTPYYQARMAWLSPQQRKIVEFLIDRRGAVPVKEIAQRCFISHQTATGQLKALREMGYIYVQAESVGRESYYDLQEPLMRICVEVKKQRGEPIRLIVDFLRFWYTRTELQQKLGLLQPHAVLEREYLTQALRATETEAEDPREAACLKDYNTYIETGEFDRALKVAEELVATRGHAEDWFNQGYCLFELGRIEEALKSYDEAIRLDQDNASTWNNRGSVLERLGRREEALISYNKAIELDPIDANARYNRGVVLARLGNFEKAMRSFEECIEFNPGDSHAWYNHGLALCKLGRWKEALESFDKAIGIDPKDARAQHNRGVTMGKLALWEEALASLDKAIELIVEDAETWAFRGIALNNLKRWEEALTSLDKAIELNPKDASTWINRSAALGGLGRYNEALESCDKAIEMGTQSWAAFFNRAEFLLALGRWEEGIAALDDALHRFAHADEFQMGDTGAILRNLFTGTGDAATFRTRIKSLMEVYDRHKVLSHLGTGVVRSISVLVPETVSDAAARGWLGVWQELAGSRLEFRIALRILDAAVRYRETHDRRILLRLPVEERKVLEELLEEKGARTEDR